MNKNYPKIYKEDIKVLGRVVSIASENKVAAAEQVFDEKFNYSDLTRYALDATASTTEGLDQYTINRLFGKKLKAFDNAGLIPDVDGFLQNIKINNITVKGGGTFTGDVTFNDNVTVKKKLNVDGGIDSKGIIRCNDVIVGWNGSDNSGYSVKDAIDRINKIISGENKDNTLWRYILGLEGRIRTLENCCENIHNQPQGGITLTVNPTSFNMNIGDTQQLTATVNPSNASDKTVTWSSSNTSIATVDANGLVTAVAVGSATITATSNADSNVKSSVNITVVDPTPVTYKTQWDGDPHGSINGTSIGSVYVYKGTPWSGTFNLNKVNDNTYALLSVRLVDATGQTSTYLEGFKNVRIDDPTYQIDIPAVNQGLIITWSCYNTQTGGDDATYSITGSHAYTSLEALPAIDPQYNRLLDSQAVSAGISDGETKTLYFWPEDGYRLDNTCVTIKLHDGTDIPFNIAYADTYQGAKVYGITFTGVADEHKSIAITVNAVQDTNADWLYITAKGEHAEILDYGMQGGTWRELTTSGIGDIYDSVSKTHYSPGEGAQFNIRPTNGYKVTFVSFEYDGEFADENGLTDTLDVINSSESGGLIYISGLRSNATIIIHTEEDDDADGFYVGINVDKWTTPQYWDPDENAWLDMSDGSSVYTEYVDGSTHVSPRLWHRDEPLKVKLSVREPYEVTLILYLDSALAGDSEPRTYWPENDGMVGYGTLEYDSSTGIVTFTFNQNDSGIPGGPLYYVRTNGNPLEDYFVIHTDSEFENPQAIFYNKNGLIKDLKSFEDGDAKLLASHSVTEERYPDGEVYGDIIPNVIDGGYDLKDLVVNGAAYAELYPTALMKPLPLFTYKLTQGERVTINKE